MKRSFGQARRAESADLAFSSRQILLPKFSKHDPETLGALEDIVRKTSLVDDGLRRLQGFEHNTPRFDPERRRFLKVAAACAGLLALDGCASVEYQGKTYDGWQAKLMAGDLIRGPGLIFNGGCYRDFQCHQRETPKQVWGVDYDVPRGTPVTPSVAGYVDGWHNIFSGNTIQVTSKYNGRAFGVLYKHLASIRADKVKRNVDRSQRIAFSGNSGQASGGEEVIKETLHFQVHEADPKTYKFTDIFDPFTLGVDGGRPTYWDTKTNFYDTPPGGRKHRLEFFLDSLPPFLTNAQIDEPTKKNLLELRSDPGELRKYLGKRVLEKGRGPDGKRAYEFLPGSDMYYLMLQIYSLTRTNDMVLMLPFPHPMLLDFYRARNVDWSDWVPR